MNKKKKKISVIGCGGWGTALSMLLCEAGHTVSLWGVDAEYMDSMGRSRENTVFLPDIEIPRELTLSGDLHECLENSGVVVAATPTVYMREVCERFADSLRQDHLIINVAKGIEEETLLTGTGIIRDVCGEDINNIAGLYGPSHAEEVARGMPTTVVAASPDEAAARRVQDIFMTPAFRVYTNTDLIGAEIGAALKNVIAVAAGVCDGLDFGDNAKSALLTRGLAETRRLGMALGARGATFAGLTGLGDLITTCVSPHGRNRKVGFRLGRGEKLDDILSDMNQVAEGVRTTRSAYQLARKQGVDMPITGEVYALLFEGKDPLQSGYDLMRRRPRPELDADS